MTPSVPDARIALVTEGSISDPVAVILPPNQPLPCTVSSEDGEVVPIPTFPFARIVKSVDPDEEATVKRFFVLVPCINSEVVF